MRSILFICLLQFWALLLNAQESISIQGRTLDSGKNNTIDFVNIGIEGKNVGTVSNASGEFQLKIPEHFLNDSLSFSRIGYFSKRVSIDEIRKVGKCQIFLKPRITEIDEVKIISKRLNKKKKGNIARSRGIIFAITSDSNELGHEIGTVIHIGKDPVILKDFNFHIVTNRPDSVKFRLNLYQYKNEAIERNLLDDNIYFTIRNGNVGDFKVDLSKYNIVFRENILIAVEIVGVFVTDLPNPEIKYDNYYFDRVSISGSLIKGREAFIKKVSQGNWVKIPNSFSPGFWITILK